MNIRVPTEPFILELNLLETSKLDKNQNVYKFSLDFLHFENREIKFSLPEDYRTYLYTSDLNRLAEFFCQKLNS